MRRNHLRSHQSDTARPPRLAHAWPLSRRTIASVAGVATLSALLAACLSPPMPPGPVTALTAVASPGQSVVSWIPPSPRIGSPPVTGYRVTVSRCTTTVSTLSFGTATSETITGLTNGATYELGVQAVNARGAGRLVEANPVTPTVAGTTAGPVRALSAVAGVGTATVSWTAPVTHGTSAITGYRVSSFIGSTCTGTQVFAGTATRHVVTGLSGGTIYTLSVQAGNASGDGPIATSNAVTPATPRVPGAVGSAHATAGTGHATVSWTAPTDPGTSPINGYHVSINTCGGVVGSVSFPSTARNGVVTGLTNGVTYTFGVAATNVVGTGPAVVTNAVAPVGAGAPGSVSALTAAAANGQAAVSWHAPSRSGASPITSYRIAIYAAGKCTNVQTFTNAATSQLLTGLSAGTSYTFAVQAINARGAGPASMSNAVTPLSTFTRFTDARISSPQGIAVGPDGALWFNLDSNSIGRITTNGAISAYTDRRINQPYRVAAGPDGAMWFTSSGSNAIGRVTTSGAITMFTDPSISTPAGIAAGPDRALWFTNIGNNGIGRITTSGAITHYSDPSIDDPAGIVAGPDGALWFANNISNSIGRITTSGAITIYTDPRIVGPAFIAPGPDGALWFTNDPGVRGPGSIGRITTSGAITIYTDPSIDQPYGIARGRDGALWFTNLGGSGSIGRITTGGALSFYTDASISYPEGIVAGPDGALWFTNTSGNSIGRFAPGPYATVSPPSGPAGMHVTVTGAGFHAGASITATYGTGLASPNQVKICVTTADRNGAFQCSGSIPSGANAGTLGVHTVAVKGQVPADRANAWFDLN